MGPSSLATNVVCSARATSAHSPSVFARISRMQNTSLVSPRRMTPPPPQVSDEQLPKACKLPVRLLILATLSSRLSHLLLHRRRFQRGSKCFRALQATSTSTKQQRRIPSSRQGTIIPLYYRHFADYTGRFELYPTNY